MPDDQGRTTYQGPAGGLADAMANAKPPAPPPDTSASGIKIEIGEGGEVYFKPASPAVKRDRSKARFDENLADVLDDRTLSQIGEDYLNGVATDIMSRSEFIANYNKGIDLLGLKIEEASSVRGPRQSISKVRHPVLLEACVRYQSAARAELLPASGPVKIATIGGSTAPEDQLARDFESDFNYYLTDIAKEYYPDTDRALFYQAFGGSMYKKVFRCPIRRRPVSESVNMPQLIVSEDATDLDNAIRVTHEANVSPAFARRMQLSGAWKDTTLGYPMGSQNQAVRKILESQGLAPVTSRPQDREHTIYEGYLDLDPSYYGFEEHAPEGLPLPYRVVVDRDSHKILGIHRNWKNDDEDFKRKRVFVKYGLIPGLGFLDYGFLHLVGNQARALTMIWRILIDAGIFSNFPGGVKVKGVRMSTNEIQPGPGQWPDVDIGQMNDIRQAFMPMPYKGPDAVFIQLAELIAQDAQRMGGAVELEVGEGRANVPVGTIMAMIEQQTQVIGAVHKRNHTAQKEELEMLRELFIEDPAALTRLARKPARRWEVAEEFADLDLSPASDPNVPAQMHRVMMATLLEQLGSQDPVNLDRKAIHRRAFRAININDGDELIVPGPATPPPQPGAAPAGPAPNPAAGLAAAAKMQELPIKQGQLALGQKKLELQLLDTQREAAAEATETQQREADRQVQLQIESANLGLKREQMERDHHLDALGMFLEHQRHGDTLDQTERLHRPAPADVNGDIR